MNHDFCIITGNLKDWWNCTRGWNFQGNNRIQLQNSVI